MRLTSLRVSRLTRAVVLATSAASMLNGCALQRYRVAPLAPSQTVASIRQRSLSDPALHQFFESTVRLPESAWPLGKWDLAELTLAAFYYNPALQVARARVSEAEAAVITAGARPNPSVNADLGGETSPETPWLAGIGFSLPIETAGKRGYRITEAQKLADVARWNLAAVAWNVRTQVRSALIEYIAAHRALDLLQHEDQLRSEQVKLLDQRFAVGMISQPEVDTARILRTQTLLALRAATGRVLLAQAALAAAIGMPTAALDGITVAWPEFDQLPSTHSLDRDNIQADAVLNRLDIRQALAVYASAEAALRLEIAKQYPDINLGPSYAYEEGSHLFSLGLGLVLPVFNQNQGRIAEAKARRGEMAAQFVAVQAAGIAASEQALAKYVSALNELTEARQLLQESRAQKEGVQKALHSGQSDRVALNGAQLQTAITQAAELDAHYKAQQALGELENAVQRPLVPGDIQPITPDSPALNSR